MKYTLQKCQERARNFIENSKLRNKLFYDKKLNSINIGINDLVLIRKEPYDKFEPVYSGPYKVTGVNNSNITINLNNKNYEIHKNRVVKA